MTDAHWGWILFNLFVLAMLALDLGVFHRTAHEVRVREALAWSVVWIVLAIGFAGLVLAWNDRGSEAALEFLTGYLLEKSLSVDNLFVFLLIFHYFQVKNHHQHKVLFWGILGALVMRAAFIFAGVALIKQFHWLIYVFGLFLIFTGIKLALEKDKKIEPGKNPVLQLFRRFFPVTDQYVDGRLWVRQGARLVATPLFVVLIVIETTDLIFAVDSIPAVLGISRDPFIVYTSNVFAILGLRSLYFALAGMMQLFHYLHYGLALVLVFIGGKMLLDNMPITATLAVVVVILTVSVIASILLPAPKEAVAETVPSGMSEVQSRSEVQSPSS